MNGSVNKYPSSLKVNVFLRTCRRGGRYGLELFEPDTPIEIAVEFAQTGVKFDPANQRTRLNLACALMVAGWRKI